MLYDLHDTGKMSTRENGQRDLTSLVSLISHQGSIVLQIFTEGEYWLSCKTAFGRRFGNLVWLKLEPKEQAKLEPSGQAKIDRFQLNSRTSTVALHLDVHVMELH